MQSDFPNIFRSPYDNNVTLVYKWAHAFNTPRRLLLIRPRTAKDSPNAPGTPTAVVGELFSTVAELDAEGRSPEEIIEIVNAMNQNIGTEDIAMAYYTNYISLLPLAERPRASELYLDQINRIYSDLEDSGRQRLTDSRHLEAVYQTWTAQARQSQREDTIRLDKINQIEELLTNIERGSKYATSPVIINSEVISFRPSWKRQDIIGSGVASNSKKIELEDALEIFNASRTSKHIPFIQYNDETGKQHYRIYTGSKIEEQPNYNTTILSNTKASARNTIYLTLWLGDNEGSFATAPRDSFFTVIYRLEPNYLTIETPVAKRKNLNNGEDVAITYVSTALPNLELGPGREIKVRGEFDIWELDIEEASFLDMILTDFLSLYLYVEENGRPFALKKRLDVHYRSIFSDETEGETPTSEAYISNSASVSVTLHRRIALGNEPILVASENTQMNPRSNEGTKPGLGALSLPPGSTTWVLAKGTPYVHVTILQAESRATVTEFIRIFTLLMRYYVNNREGRLRDYEQLLPETLILRELNTLKGAREESGKHKAKVPKVFRETAGWAELNRIDPAVFAVGYAREYQSGKQPLALDAAEAQKWLARPVRGSEQRQVLAFPYANPRYYIVCPTDFAPYPALKTWRNPASEVDEYVYIPGCAKEDNRGKPIYLAFINGQPAPRKTGAKGNGEKAIVTNKIMAPGGYARISRAVENILQYYSDEHTEIRRVGMIHTPNSFLHAICFALDDVTYLDQRGDIAKEAYVTQIRNYIAANTELGLLRQEMYDYSDTEIRTLMADSAVFFDPSLYYRAVEELYGINIYVFNPSTRENDENSQGALDIPRFKIFHSRPLRANRPTVILYKSIGSESNALQYPQCELIVDFDADNEQIIKLFGGEMTEICHNQVLSSTLKTATWSVDLTPGPDGSAPERAPLPASSNLYYWLDHLAAFNAAVQPTPGKVLAVSQFLDSNGKLRALTLDTGNTSLVTQRYVTIATLPSQPENLPVRSDIARVPLATAIAIFGQPSGITRTLAGEIDGLWYRVLDLTFGEYVYVIPQMYNESGLPLGPPNPLLATGVNVTGRLGKLRRTVSFIIQIVRWLYELAQLSRKLTPDEFVANYFINTNSAGDSANMYDFSRMPRRFPVLPNIESAIAALTPLVPSLFVAGRIRVYNSSFGLKLTKMLEAYDVLRPDNPVPPKGINNYYETGDDFLTNPNTKVFVGEKELNAWLKSVRTNQRYDRFYAIRERIDATMGYTNDPFLYRDEQGKIYLVQNPVGGRRLRALTIANIWSRSHVNVGANPDAVSANQEQDLLELPVLTYGINPSSQLVPIEDTTRAGQAYERLIFYGTAIEFQNQQGRYGALLELL